MRYLHFYISNEPFILKPISLWFYHIGASHIFGNVSLVNQDKKLGQNVEKVIGKISE